VDAVRAVLKDLEVSNVPTLTVWNKVDACADPEAVAAVANRREATVCVSAISGGGVDALFAAVGARLQQSMTSIKVLVPYSQGDLVEEVHRCGVVHRIEYTDEGCELEAHVPPGLAARLEKIRSKGVTPATHDLTAAAAAYNGLAGASLEDGVGRSEAAQRIAKTQ
jgi:GTP-binding protein HflX